MKKWFVYALVSVLAFAVYMVMRENMLLNDKMAGIEEANRSVPTIEKLLSAVNDERKKIGVANLVLDSALNLSAQNKTDEMHDLNYFDHTNPQTGKESGLDAIEGLSIECVYIGENLVDAKDTNDAIAQWLNSKPHREAMLDSKYNLTGFGISQDPNNKTRHFVTQHFCDVN